MGNFNNHSLQFMKACCDDEWVAQTYSEYLMHCAEEKTKLMDAITDVCNDADIEEFDDESEGIINTTIMFVEKYIAKELSISGISYTTIEINSDDYREKWDEYFSDPLHAYMIQDINDQLGTNYDKDSLYSDYLMKGIYDMISGSPNYLTLLESKVDGKISDLGYNSSTTFTLHEGFCNLKEIFMKVSIKTDCSSEDDFRISIVDSENNNIGYTNLSVSDFWNQCKADLSSTTAWATGFAAAGLSTISDRLQNFDAMIKNLLSDASAKFASTVSTVRSMIADSHSSVSSFINQASELLGWNAVAQSMAIVVNDTDIANYTGASPLGDINLDSAKGIATATAKTICAAGNAIWNGIKSGVKKIWSKIRPTVMSITNNPYDLDRINTEAKSYTVDGWCYTKNNNHILLKVDDLGSEAYASYTRVFSNKLNEWIKVNTIFGEVLFRVTGITENETIVDSQTLASKSGLGITFDIQMKPKCMNPNTVISYLNDPSGSDPDYYNCLSYSSGIIPNLIDKINSFKESGDMYADVEMSEKATLTGFIMGSTLLSQSFSVSAFEVRNALRDNNVEFIEQYIDNNPNDSWMYLEYQQGCNGYYNESLMNNVTNLDFLKACSGYNGNSLSPDFNSTYSLTKTNNVISMTERAANLYYSLSIKVLMNIVEVWRDQYMNPLDFEYYPYSSDNVLFDEPRFKIKTDSQNKSIAQNFYNILVVVTVIAIGIIVAGSIVRITKASKLARLSRSVGMKDNAMWNGKKLSFSEKLSYARKSRKLSKITDSTAGLAAGSSSSEGINELKKLISQNITTSLGISSGQNISADNGIQSTGLITDSEKLDRIYYKICGQELNPIQ